jgi:hypothetical protein
VGKLDWKKKPARPDHHSEWIQNNARCQNSIIATGVLYINAVLYL